MMKILIFLQNAWGVEDGYIPTFERESFRDCYTGKRLKEMFPNDAKVTIRNATPSIGRSASSNIPPDYEYVMGEIEQIDFDVILACGVNAKKAVEKALSFALCKLPVVYAPHPAWRSLSKKITSEIRSEVESFAKTK